MDEPGNHGDLSLTQAVRRVVDGGQRVMLAHVAALRAEVRGDLDHAVKGLAILGAAAIALHGAWLALIAFWIREIDAHLPLLPSLAIVASLTGVLGVSLVLTGLARLRPRDGKGVVR